MKRYRIRAFWMDDERLDVPSMTVLETDRGWRRSGLLDHHGNELMSRDQMQPIGFLTEFLSQD